MAVSAFPTSSSPTPAVSSLDERLGGRRWRRFVRNKAAMIAAVFLALLVLSAVLAPLLAPHDPNDNDLVNTFAPLGSNGHLLGTDDLGRDVLSRLLFASRVSLLAGLGAVSVSLVIAIPFGLVAGYFGGRLDGVLMRLIDALLAIPPLIMVFAVAGVLGPSLRNAIIALGVLFTPTFIRLIRAEVRGLRNGQLVEAERSVGVPNVYLMWRHILPNVASPIIVQASLAVGSAILAEASLSFIGLGVQPPTPSWGSMLRTAFNNITAHTDLVFVPALAIALTVLALNVVGDGLRDALGRIES